MKNFAVDFLKPEMTFSEPVYIEGESVFVAAGVPIRQKDIDRLTGWGLTTVHSNGEPIGPPVREPPPPPLPAKPHPLVSLTEVKENKTAYRTYTLIIERLDTAYIAIKNCLPPEPHIINDICDQLLQGVREHKESFIDFILGGEVDGWEMAKCSVNTAILAALIALELRLPHHKIMQIVTGALLHDAGMLRLPKILDKRGGLSEAETQKMKSHPLLAHKIATREFSYPNEVANIVLQHHERWDGGGYPQGLAGTAIDLGARIVSVADAFEAMVSEKPYRNSMVGYQAIKNLMSDNFCRFDPEILKAFILTMGIYPIGSFVLLNNGVLARIFEVRASAPLRPRIQVLVDAEKKVFQPGEGPILDLLTEKHCYITKAIDSKEVAGLYA